MTPTKKKRLSKDRSKSSIAFAAGQTQKVYETASGVIVTEGPGGMVNVDLSSFSATQVPIRVEECSTCYAHRDFPDTHPGQTRCALYPDWTQRSKTHWCAQWKQIKERQRMAAVSIAENGEEAVW